MTPDQLAKSGTEHGTQAAFFAWCAMAHMRGFDVAWKYAEIGADALLGLPREVVAPKVPALAWIHAIPNGGALGDDEQTRRIRGGNKKAEGVREGVPDVFLPWPIRNHVFKGCDFCDNGDETEIVYAGLYIEFKKPALRPKKEGGKGGLSDKQIDFGEYAKANGYGWAVCYDWREAATMVQQYIEWQG